MTKISRIDVCKMSAARGGCDLTLAPYQVSDMLSPQERVDILTAMAIAGSRSRDVCAAASSAVSKYMKQPVVSDPAVKQEAQVNALLEFLQKDVGYVDDPEGEWYQGPLYTLAHGGDCEDLASLLLSMCDCLGIASRLVWMEQPKSKLNHVTAQVLLSPSGGVQKNLHWEWWANQAKNENWRWAETTISSARVGMHPYDAANRYGNANRIHGSGKILGRSSGSVAGGTTGRNVIVAGALGIAIGAIVLHEMRSR